MRGPDPLSRATQRTAYGSTWRMRRPDALSADLDRLTPIDTNEPTVPEHHA